jgi:ABC-type nickel/cobalt efflux system permease component RcnA
MTTLAVVIGVVFVLGFGLWLAFRQARKRSRAEAAGAAHRAAADHARESHAIREDVARLPDAELDCELRRYTRSE